MRRAIAASVAEAASPSPAPRARSRTPRWRRGKGPLAISPGAILVHPRTPVAPPPALELYGAYADGPPGA